MKQILQDINTGKTLIVSSPSPQSSSETLLISSSVSLISSGTERSLSNFGRSNFLGKAMQQPEKVKEVLEKVGTDGLFATISAVRSKLSQPIPLGYSNVGRVIEVGKGVNGFKVGDRVVSNGPHADIVRVSPNLCAHIPDSVSDETAAYTVVASIGLQGLRLSAPTLGESFVVIGAGLIGLLTIQLLIANGCRVLAIDFNEEKLAIARAYGAETCNLSAGEDSVDAGRSFSAGRGVDGVIVTATTVSSDPISQAANMCRKRGRIILVGVTGLNLNRNDFYKKELQFQVSCSYGPGRYDSKYEVEGHDYPLAFVRWTEQRNFEAVLNLMASGSLNVDKLISHRFDFDNADRAYDRLISDSNSLGILLTYTLSNSERIAVRTCLDSRAEYLASTPCIGFIGAGNYASRVLLPILASRKFQLHTIVSSGGVNAVVHGSKSGFANASTDIEQILKRKDIDTVFIATRHDSHASIVERCLVNNKNVFVEKPLAINRTQLEQLQNVYLDTNGPEAFSPQLMVGFNRRFSPQIKKIRELLESTREPSVILITVNAGSVPSDHWTQSIDEGGGRIVGEACHFIDLMRCLAASSIEYVIARKMKQKILNQNSEDNATITIGFKNGTLGTLLYLTNGSRRFPKERVEIFNAGRVLSLDNFRKLSGYSWPGFTSYNLWKQDKGQRNCVDAFLNSVQSGVAAIDPNEIFEVSFATIDAMEQLREQ